MDEREAVARALCAADGQAPDQPSCHLPGNPGWWAFNDDAKTAIGALAPYRAAEIAALTAAHDRRVTELLEANNALVEQRRERDRKIMALSLATMDAAKLLLGYVTHHLEKRTDDGYAKARRNLAASNALVNAINEANS